MEMAVIDIQSRFSAKLIRFRRVIRPALFWAIIGGLVGSFWNLPQLTDLIAEQGYMVWLARSFLSAFVPAGILVGSLFLFMDVDVDMAQRPLRFLAALVIGATVGVAAVWAMLAGVFQAKTSVALPIMLTEAWSAIMLFGGIFGWAAILNIQRAEGQRRLGGLLAQRSALTLQVAHSTLLTARAKIDPEMVARMLREVRRRYGDGSEQAPILLDNLIGYLRLAMSRKREKRPSFSGEMSLVHSYIALREAESGLQIDLHVNVQGEAMQSRGHALPIFAIAKCLIDQAIAQSTVCIVLHIDVIGAAMAIGLDTGVTPLEEGALATIRAQLAELPAGSELAMHSQLLDTGSYRYVVKLSA